MKFRLRKSTINFNRYLNNKTAEYIIESKENEDSIWMHFSAFNETSDENAKSFFRYTMNQLKEKQNNLDTLNILDEFLFNDTEKIK